MTKQVSSKGSPANFAGPFRELYKDSSGLIRWYNFLYLTVWCSEVSYPLLYHVGVTPPLAVTLLRECHSLWSWIHLCRAHVCTYICMYAPRLLRYFWSVTRTNYVQFPGSGCTRAAVSRDSWPELSVQSVADRTAGTVRSSRDRTHRARNVTRTAKMAAAGRARITDRGYMSRKIQTFRTDKFDTWNKRKFWVMQLMLTAAGTSHLHELHESKFPFVSHIEFICSKLSNFAAHVSGITLCRQLGVTDCGHAQQPYATNAESVGQRRGKTDCSSAKSENPFTWTHKNKQFDRINSISETNGSFDTNVSACDFVFFLSKNPTHV